MRTGRDYALQTHEILGRYIEVHDRLFGGSWVRKLLPIPGIFKAIDFPKCVSDLERLRGELGAIRSEVLTASEDGDDRYLLMTLLNFIDALELTLAGLQEICDALAGKAQGAVYPKEGYDEDVAEYQNRVATYQEVGGALNAAMAS